MITLRTRSSTLAEHAECLDISKIKRLIQPPLRVKDRIDLPCVCLICEQYRDKITTVHAKSHGYIDKYAMVADGKVRFIGRVVDG